MSSSYLTIYMPPTLYCEVFEPEYLPQFVGPSATRDDALPIRKPCPGHTQDSYLLAAESLDFLRSLSNMVEQPFPERYLEYLV